MIPMRLRRLSHVDHDGLGTSGSQPLHQADETPISPHSFQRL